MNHEKHAECTARGYPQVGVCGARSRAQPCFLEAPLSFETFETLQPFLTAAAIGLLLGFERERRHRASVPQAAGARTFALLALGGAIAASLDPWVVAAGFAGAAALIAISYVRTSTADPGLTTEIAAGVAYLLGALAFQQGSLAVSLAVVVAGLLVSKDRLHHLAREIVTDVEVEDAIKFLMIAFVVLPILPDRDLGPFGALNPRRIWLLVVALTGLGWLGYLGVKLLGAKRGLLFAGLAGGFVSASATTASMARLAAETPSSNLRGPLAAALTASVATLLQLGAVLAFVSPSLLEHLLPALVLSGLALLVVAAGVARGGGRAPEAPATGRPFALRPALVLAGILTLALLVARAGTAWLGAGGAALASAFSGLADAHAGSLAAATLFARGDLSQTEALVAIAAALGSNTIVKIVLAFTGGGARFGVRFAAAMAPAVLAFALGVALGSRWQ
jgi:uncharacterized membrane protein (DUF4010 family)